MAVLSDYDLAGGETIFTYCDSWLHKHIFWFSKWRVSRKDAVPIAHVALYLGEIKGIPMMAEAGMNGIRIKTATKYNSLKYQIRVARPKGVALTKRRLEKLQAYSFRKHGERYAFLQLVALAVKAILGLRKVGDWDRDAMVCSEFVAMAYQAGCSHRAVEGQEPYEINPLDLYVSKNMDKMIPRW
ncbi:MAG: hypothetical protein GY853_01495 [PVC group bacterium]|nr:hypothetical protein [PVC group bacterium]